MSYNDSWHQSYVLLLRLYFDIIMLNDFSHRILYHFLHDYDTKCGENQYFWVEDIGTPLSSKIHAVIDKSLNIRRYFVIHEKNASMISASFVAVSPALCC